MGKKESVESVADVLFGEPKLTVLQIFGGQKLQVIIMPNANNEKLRTLYSRSNNFISLLSRKPLKITVITNEEDLLVARTSRYATSLEIHLRLEKMGLE